MPTSGKAIGAVLFAILAIAVAAMIAPQFPAAISRDAALAVAAGVGLATGWRMGGDRRGGTGAAAARGVTAAVVLVLGTLAIGATWLMVRRSLRGIYDGPVEALGDAASLFAELGLLMLAPGPAGLLLVGGALAGIVAGAVALRCP